MSRFFQHGKLTEIQSSIYNPKTRIVETKIFNAQNRLLNIRKETYNEFNDLVKLQEFDKKEHLLYEQEYEIENSLIIKEITKDYINDAQELIIDYEYDENDNLIKNQVKTPSGDLLEFHHQDYDKKNRLVDEKGFSDGDFNAIYGTYENEAEFHFIYKYIA